LKSTNVGGPRWRLVGRGLLIVILSVVLFAIVLCQSCYISVGLVWLILIGNLELAALIGGVADQKNSLFRLNTAGANIKSAFSARTQNIYLDLGCEFGRVAAKLCRRIGE
jgi:hypothetical protein